MPYYVTIYVTYFLSIPVFFSNSAIGYLPVYYS